MGERSEPPVVIEEGDEDEPSELADGFNKDQRGDSKGIQMQLLTVPDMSLGPPVEETGGGGSDRNRRYSYTHSGKITSPNTRRRSSLAAIKWSALARRLSMGMGHDREPPDDPEKAVAEVNSNVAQFRDLLIHIGQSRDGPELREKIRKTRRVCLDSCRHAVQLLLQQIRSDVAEGLPVDFNPPLVLLFFCTQLFLRELGKCKRLVTSMPIDMTSFYENRPGTSNLGNVLSQLLLCRQLTPDFNQEEVCSIEKDAEDIMIYLEELQEFMPKENSQSLSLPAGEDSVFSRWARRRRRLTCPSCHFNMLCCVSNSTRYVTTT